MKIAHPLILEACYSPEKGQDPFKEQFYKICLVQDIPMLVEPYLFYTYFEMNWAYTFNRILFIQLTLTNFEIVQYV